jgi:UBX domain-containing protein 1
VAGAWEVDESAPVTSLQLRLLDGSRVVARFNAGHTVAHIRAFIERLRPGTGAVGVLQVAGMPPKTLTDMGATLADAGLLNAVVIQKA